MELFVRKANLHLYIRNWPRLVSHSAPRSRSLINRVAFFTLADAGVQCPNFADKLAFVGSHKNLKATEFRLIGAQFLTDEDVAEAAELSTRMCRHLYHSEAETVELSPSFAGCGIINACLGDAMSGSAHIIELKDGDRPFRSYEFRQLTVYSALHLNSTGRMPSSIEVVNSRRGVSIKLAMETFAAEVAGQPAHEYLREVVRVISDISLSR
jgi:hypothetical protein